jgi:hypothetical protein
MTRGFMARVFGNEGKEGKFLPIPRQTVMRDSTKRVIVPNIGIFIIIIG